MNPPRLLLTSGEPAGIGPEIIVQIAQEPSTAELVVIADPELLIARAQQLKQPLTLIPFDKKKPPTLTPPTHLKIIPLPLSAPCQAGHLNIENAAYVIHMLEYAAQAALDRTVDGLVTAPVHKSILNKAGFAFQGHTEFFAAYTNMTDIVMLFVLNTTKQKLAKVALTTIHIPLAEVPRTLTAKKLESTIKVLHQGLVHQFKQPHPVIFVCGLNPHAGEAGYLGKEEIEIIIPTLETLRQEGFKLVGPLSADSMFTAEHFATADAILAMYHDQALPVVKALSFGKAVNVTLGLPFIRTSVDHGTALDLAGTGKADTGSLKAAIQLASDLATLT